VDLVKIHTGERLGKRIIQQRRGSANPRYTALSHRFKGEAKHPPLQSGELTARVVDLIKCPAHTAPLAKVSYSNGDKGFMIAPENIYVGMDLSIKRNEIKEDEISFGNTMPLRKVPEGTFVYNIESVPGDGGKYVRSSGTFARVVGFQEDKVIVILPSKKTKLFNGECRATIGIVSGGGRLEKPIVKAGNQYYKMSARRHLWPSVSGGSMNAVDHPFGNKRSSRKAKVRVASRHAPPGRKVGMVAARRTGRKKR